jgi:hypothetical protein
MKTEIAFYVCRAISGVGAALIAGSNIGRCPIKRQRFPNAHEERLPNLIQVSWWKIRCPTSCVPLRLGYVSLGYLLAVLSASQLQDPLVKNQGKNMMQETPTAFQN